MENQSEKNGDNEADKLGGHMDSGPFRVKGAGN